MKALKILLILMIAIFIACPAVVTEGEPGVKEIKYTIGKKEMIIKKDERTGKVISVKDKEGKDVERVPIGQLKLMRTDEEGKTYQITYISDDTLIETTSSPGCKWYCYRGTCYKI